MPYQKTLQKKDKKLLEMRKIALNVIGEDDSLNNLDLKKAEKGVVSNKRGPVKTNNFFARKLKKVKKSVKKRKYKKKKKVKAYKLVILISLIVVFVLSSILFLFFITRY